MYCYVDKQAYLCCCRYGGPMILQANVTFKPYAPASSFADSKITNLFFRTTDCLRVDKSGCHNDPADPFYQITHTGLDAQVSRGVQSFLIVFPMELRYTLTCAMCAVL